MYDITEKQKNFCIEFIKCGVASRAAETAGYAKGSSRIVGCDLLSQPKIQEIIEKLQELVYSDKILDMQETLERITSIARNEQKEEVIFPDFKGGKVMRTTKDVSIKDRLKALELMAKILGLYKETNNLNAQINVQIVDDL